MRTPLRATVAAAAIAGAGLAGFGLTSALAQTSDETPSDQSDTTTTDDSARPDGVGCQGGPGLDAMAEAIGIDVEDLRAALQDGQTPAEVAEDNGVSRADLVDAVVASINEHLDQAVEEGRLTEEEADERRADAEDNANAIVDGERPEGFGPHGPGGPEA
jgi:hypothetical protein